MKLLIISHTPHYKREGVLVGWTDRICEIDQLSRLFEQVVHIAPLHPGPPPDSAINYCSSRVQVRPVPRSGGERIWNKLFILVVAPIYMLAMFRQLRTADVIHVRCPANISLFALLLLLFTHRSKKRWIKYAGNWAPNDPEALSYTIQRWLLRRRARNGIVTVNGLWPNQPDFVHPFFNPCLNEQELQEGAKQAECKSLTNPVRLLFVGRLDHGKGVARALRVLARLNDIGCNAVLDLVGDGSERVEFERLATNLGVQQRVTFHGWQPRTKLTPLYSSAHLIILPTSSSEGWPKVISEAMAFGVVPLASNVSSIPQYLQMFGVGRSFHYDEIEAFVSAVQWYVEHPENWKTESGKGVKSAEFFSYRYYLKALGDLLKDEKTGCMMVPLPAQIFRQRSSS